MINKLFIFAVTSCLCLSPLAAQNQAQSQPALEAELEQLKTDILQEKVKMRQLEETLLFGKLNATYVYLTFRNEAQDNFEFVSGTFYLNDKIVRQLNSSDLGKQEATALLIYEASLPPGENIVTLKLAYKGKKQGPLTYVENYNFTVDSKKSITTIQGKTTALEIVVADRGLLKSEYKDRLFVTYNLTTGL